MDGGKRSKWLTHVKKTMKAHKGKSLKQVLKMAKKTYRGGADAVESGPSHTVEAAAPSTPGALSPAAVGGRRRRTARKTRKGGRKH